MKKFILPFLFILLAFCHTLLAQDTLPKFSVNNIGSNRVVISWKNTYGLVKQINIQRSHDSTKNYTTILNVADPMNRENGFADTKAANNHMFYRLFIVLDKGMFYFTEAKKPVFDSTRKPDLTRIDKMSLADSLSYPVNYGVNGNTKVDVFIPSSHVFAQRDGYIRVNLPYAQQKKYSIKFYDEYDSFLFELKNIRQSFFTVEKTNFYHAGWFRFELFENEILIEKHKFFIPKDF